MACAGAKPPGQPRRPLRKKRAMPRRSPEKPPSHADAGAPPFLQLDYLYVPSADVAKDLKYFTGVLGGEVGFAVDGMGARVALERLTNGPPHACLTDHL